MRDDGKPYTDKQLRSVFAVVLGGDETDDRTDLVFRAYRATLYGAVPGVQRKDSALWPQTKYQAQAALLRSLKAARRAGRLGP